MTDDQTSNKLRQIADAIGMPVSAFLNTQAPCSPDSSDAASSADRTDVPSRQTKDDLTETAELLALWNATGDKQIRARVLTILRVEASPTSVSDEAKALAHAMRNRD